MKKKQNMEYYDFKVEEQDFVPNKENPKKVFITISFEYGGDRHLIEHLKFSPQQVATGSWESVAVTKIDDKIDSLESCCRHDVPELEGVEIHNDGPNTPEPGYDYPDRPEQ